MGSASPIIKGLVMMMFILTKLRINFITKPYIYNELKIINEITLSVIWLALLQIEIQRWIRDEESFRFAYYTIDIMIILINGAFYILCFFYIIRNLLKKF